MEESILMEMDEMENELAGLTNEELTDQLTEVSKEEIYRVGEHQVKTREEFVALLANCIAPRTGIISKSWVFPSYNRKKWKTEELYDQDLRRQLKNFDRVDKFPQGMIEIRNPKAKILLIQSAVNFQWDKKEFGKPVYMSMQFVNFTVQAEIRHYGDENWSSPHIYKFGMLGERGMEVLKMFKQGEPFIMRISEKFTASGPREVYEINPPLPL